MKKFKGLTILTICIGVILSSSNILAQGVGIGDTDFTPNDHAILELRSTTKGFLPPKMTKASRMAISSNLVATDIGLTVYQTDGMAGLYAWTGSNWTSMNATPIGAVKGFLTKQDPIETGWAPMSAASTVDVAQFPAFADLVDKVTATNSTSSLGTKNTAGTSITIVDLNTEGRFLRGSLNEMGTSSYAGITEDQATAPNGLKYIDAYLSNITYLYNNKAKTVTISQVVTRTYTGDTKQTQWVRNEDSDDGYYIDQKVFKNAKVTGGGTETRPLNYSVIWHVYVGLPVN